jgi:serine/threonine protein kinase
MAAPRLLQPGDLVGKYRVEKVLGFGGMGVVYRAVDTTLPRLRVAIKVLSLVHDANMVARFKREADVLADITSRHVVQIFGTGTVDFPASEGVEAETVPYIVMELLRGHDLTDLLVKERRLSVERAVDILLGVLSALRACHEQGIIHRDVKPKNIFLHHGNEGETVKLVDFGVSLMPFGSEITGINGVAGTKEYMSPEHASLKTIDARSDQFSAAVVLYGCLAGGLPWPKTADFATHVRRLLAGTYDRLEERRPELPKTLIDVIDRGLKVSPDDRFPSVRDMGESLPFASPIGRGLFRSVLEVRRRPEQSGPVPVRPLSTDMADSTPPEKALKTTDGTVFEEAEPISVVLEPSSAREPKSPVAIAPNRIRRRWSAGSTKGCRQRAADHCRRRSCGRGVCHHRGDARRGPERNHEDRGCFSRAADQQCCGQAASGRGGLWSANRFFDRGSSRTSRARRATDEP